MAKVTTIPATISRFTATPINERKKRRTAAYARVSTDSEEQLTSYSAQVDYYTNYIKSRDDWEFVSVYTDEGITGTNTKHREGFKRMVADALAGKIDLIVTKSVSRFARNTVDSLTTVRQLKEKGVEIYFEKENIWTLDSKGELLITIMSVSYTHLYFTDLMVQEGDRLTGYVINTETILQKYREDGSIVPVSYTHLSDYTRHQADRRTLRGLREPGREADESGEF